MSNILNNIKGEINKYKNEDKAKSSEWFFKTGKDEYGEGDIFLGLTVPECRSIAKKYFTDIDILDIEKLLQSKYHEERLIALHIMTLKYNKAKSIKSKDINKELIKENIEIRKSLFDLYFKNIKYINNWDLVDTSAYNIVGDYIKEKYSLNTKDCSGVKFLLSLASDKCIFANPNSKNNLEKLWEKRIAIVSCFAFMLAPHKTEYSKEIIFDVVKKILKEKDQRSESLNKHDLIQKACGWMLREYGKRIDSQKLRDFLNNNFEDIRPRRVMLRYTIEKFDKTERDYWLKK